MSGQDYVVYNDSVSFSKVFHTQLNDLFFLLRKVKFLLSLTYLLFYLLPLVPSKHYRIVLRPRPLKDESKAPNCYKGPDKMLKIVLVPKNSSGPSQAVEGRYRTNYRDGSKENGVNRRHEGQSFSRESPGGEI